MKRSNKNNLFYLFFLLNFFLIIHNQAMNGDSRVLDKEDRDILDKEIEQELRIKKGWHEFMEPLRTDFKEKNAALFYELKEGGAELNQQEINAIEELAQDFILQNLIKICAFALKQRQLTEGTEEAVRYTYRFNSVFIGCFKEELLSYFRGERAMYLVMYELRKRVKVL